MLKEMKQQLAVWLRQNKTQTHNNLIEYMQERINFYSRNKDYTSDAVRGMNIILGDIIRLDEEVFNND